MAMTLTTMLLIYGSIKYLFRSSSGLAEKVDWAGDEVSFVATKPPA
jgi:hypothetical protein